MGKKDYISIRVERTLDEELDQLLIETAEFKTKTQFVSDALRELMEITRMKNSLSPMGQIYFKDFLTQCKWQVYQQAKEIQKEKEFHKKFKEQTGRKFDLAHEETDEFRIKKK